MLTERKIVLSGTRGTIRITGGPEHAAVALAEIPDCTVHLVNEANELHAVCISAGVGTLAAPFSANAALVEKGRLIVASGGFAGQEARFQSVLRKLRLNRWQEEQQAMGTRKTAAGDAGKAFSSPIIPEQADKIPSGADSRKAEEPTPSSPMLPGEDYQPGSEAARQILSKASELFGPLDTISPAPPPRLDPFPAQFPGAVWKRVDYPGTGRYYLEGRYLFRDMRCVIYALPGEYAPVPPRMLRGFGRFLRGTDGNGYWIKVRRIR